MIYQISDLNKFKVSFLRQEAKDEINIYTILKIQI